MILPAAPSRTLPRSRSVNHASSGRPWKAASFGSLNASQSDRSMKSTWASRISRCANSRISASSQPEAFGRDADADGEVRPATPANTGEDVEYDPAAILERSAVPVRAVVDSCGSGTGTARSRGRRAVSTPSKPARSARYGSRDEVLRQLLDLGGRERARARLRVLGRADRLRADQRRGRSHAGVVQLHEREAAGSP